MPDLGAPELLAELLAGYHELEPRSWRPPPRGADARYQRIAALSRALELGSVADVAKGHFLNLPLSPARRRVLVEAAALGRDGGTPHDEVAPRFFRDCLRYRRNLDRLRDGTRIMQIHVDPALRGLEAEQQRIGAAMHPLLANVDRWLCSLLDPDDRRVELRQLVELHGWPAEPSPRP